MYEINETLLSDEFKLILILNLTRKTNDPSRMVFIEATCNVTKLEVSKIKIKI